jgi:hypothetical protein
VVVRTRGMVPCHSARSFRNPENPSFNSCSPSYRFLRSHRFLMVSLFSILLANRSICRVKYNSRSYLCSLLCRVGTLRLKDSTRCFSSTCGLGKSFDDQKRGPQQYINENIILEYYPGRRKMSLHNPGLERWRGHNDRMS